MALGGWIGKHYGWHAAFFVVGAPGLLAAFSALCSCPSRSGGRARGSTPSGSRSTSRPGRAAEDYIDLMVNSSYTYSVFGMAFYTFAIGGLAYWLPTFLTVHQGDRAGRGDHAPGPDDAVAAAIVGMSAGGWLADRLARTSPRALFVVPGRGDARRRSRSSWWRSTRRACRWIYAGIFLAEALMFINTGPCNAVIANVVMPNMRAAAYAVAIFAIHFLGDIWSPTLMGWVADIVRPATTRWPRVFGQALAAIGAVPTARRRADRPRT